MASAPAGASNEICGATQQQQQQKAAGQSQAGRTDNSGGRSDREGRPERKKWWIDPKLRADLGITDQQSVAVDQVWKKSAPALVELRQKLEKLDNTLSQMIADGVDEAKVVAQIEFVENMRADANKRRTLMIYQMHKLLTAEQRAKVRAMYEQNDPQHRGGR